VILIDYPFLRMTVFAITFAIATPLGTVLGFKIIEKLTSLSDGAGMLLFSLISAIFVISCIMASEYFIVEYILEINNDN
jgi:hypothetical protein